MKISELEVCYVTYLQREQAVNRFLGARQHLSALAESCEALKVLSPAVRFHRRKDAPITFPLLPLTTICHYAPPLFQNEMLIAASNCIGSDRFLSKLPENYPEQLKGAFARQECARQLWSHIECMADCSEETISANLLIGTQQIHDILAVWLDLGVLVRRVGANGQVSLDLCTRVDRITEGECMHCGVKGKGRREQFFKPIACTRCGQNGYFHIRTAG